jgi:hypothetical protein
MVSRGQLIAIRRLWVGRTGLGFILFSLFVSSARAELSLTPRREDYELDGAKMWRLVFETGGPVEARYRPPEGWSYSGSAKVLRLRPDKPNAEASISRFEVPDFPPCDETGAKKLTEITLAAIPEGAEGLKIQPGIANPLQISGKDTYLIQVSYIFYGERVSRYCLYMLSSDGPMRFQLTCRESDYQELTKAFLKSLHTLQHL